MTSTSHVNKTRSQVWRYLFWLMTSALGFVMVLPLLGQQLGQFSTFLLTLQSSIDAQKQWFLAFRVSLLLLFIWTWPVLIRRLSSTSDHAHSFLRYWSRKRIIIWILIIEILFIQALPLYFL